MRSLVGIDFITIFILLFLYQSSTVAASVSSNITENNNSCNNAWPRLTLFLPVVLSSQNPRFRPNEWEHDFLTSLLMFWPLKQSKTSLVIVGDDEYANSTIADSIRQVIRSVSKKYHSFDISLHLNNISAEYYRSVGHWRQQLLMFLAYEYITTNHSNNNNTGTNSTTSKQLQEDSEDYYIGFVDTDTSFVTQIFKHDLFETSLNLPVVNAVEGFPTNKNFYAKNTHDLLDVSYAMKCMTYFPVIIKRKHLIQLRKFLLNRFPQYGGNFYKLFEKEIIRNGQFGQFDVMCNYLFYNHRDEYRWYIHEHNFRWDRHHPPPVNGQNMESSLYTPEMRRVKPRIATHGHQNLFLMEPDEGKIYHLFMLQTGVCQSPSLQYRKYPQCLKWKQFHELRNESTSYLPDMLIFECYDYGKRYENEQRISLEYFKNKHVVTVDELLTNRIEEAVRCLGNKIFDQNYSLYELYGHSSLQLIDRIMAKPLVEKYEIIMDPNGKDDAFIYGDFEVYRIDKKTDFFHANLLNKTVFRKMHKSHFDFLYNKRDCTLSLLLS